MELVYGSEGLLNYYRRMETIRDTLPFDIDGIVYKLDDLSGQHEMGFVARAPVGPLPINFRPKNKPPLSKPLKSRLAAPVRPPQSHA